MVGRILIYGANGYTGRLTARRAKQLGLKPVLAGRNQAVVKMVADTHTFDWAAFDLSDPSLIDKHLTGIDVVLHMAGPFSATAQPMVEACLRTGTHYLDITGEYRVIEALSARFADAQAAGIMVLPGTGFDVVPSDCLLAHMKRRLPQATKLTLGIAGLNAMSRGTAKTAIEALGHGTVIRRNGALVELKDPVRQEIDFGEGPVDCVGISWGDVSSGYHSTAVPDIQVFFEATPELEKATSLGPLARWVMRRGPVQSWLKTRMDERPEGPSKEERESAQARLVAIAEDDRGRRAVSRLTTPEGYALTAEVALDIAIRAADGSAVPGFATPSRFLGPDYILEFTGVSRDDLT